MDFPKRIKLAVQALTNKTENSLPVSEANRFLRFGNGEKPLMQNWSDVKMSDENLYKDYGYAVITKRANRTSVLGRRFIETEASKKTTEQYQKKDQEIVHPYLTVIKRSKEYTKKQFWYEISTYLDLKGVYYLGTVRNSRITKDGEVAVGAVQQFVLINPYEVRRVINETTGEVGGYVESHNGFYREWAPEQIIEIRMLNPFNKDQSYSMMDAARESQFTLRQASDYTRQTINGNISAPGIVTTDVELDPQKFENFKARIIGHQKGEPIFGNGSGVINWQDMQIDLDKAALDKINAIQRDILLAVAAMSKTTAGIEESGTTRDTSEVQDANFTVDAIIPRAEDIADALNLDYRKWYKEWEQNEFEIVVDSPVEKDRDAELKDVEIRTAEVKLAQQLIDAGYDRQKSFAFASGEITWEELGEPIDDQNNDPNPPTPDTPSDNQNTDAVTAREEDGAVPEDVTSPTPDTSNNSVSTTKFLTQSTAIPGIKPVVGNSIKIANQISSRDFPELYDDMEIDTDNLGCIMLDLKPMKVMEHMQGHEDELFANPKWDQGAVPAETVPHVTLLYGLLENGNTWKNKVDALLKGWNVNSVKINHVGYFDTPDSYAVVAHLEKTSELVDGHERLTLLPHVNTFSEYMPHMTLAYVKKTANVNNWVSTLNKEYAGKTVDAVGINYGDRKEEAKKSDNAVESSLSSIGHEHYSVSPTGLIVAENALDDATRDIIKAQQNKLRDGFEIIEREMVEAAANNQNLGYLTDNGAPLTKAQQKKFEQEVDALLNVFYINLYPIFGRQLLAQRSAEYGVVGTYEMTSEAQDYIEQMAQKASISHVATVMEDILTAATIAYGAAIITELILLVTAAAAAGKKSVLDVLPDNPTQSQIEVAVLSGKFDDTDMYKEAQKLALQGEGRTSISNSIRKKYPEISKNRATTIARTEAARVFNQSQFEADRQFLNSSGLMPQAYKQLRSRTGTPCAYCKLLIDMPPIPFMKNFADLGSILSVTETSDNGAKKVKHLPINWESISAGNVHPNCNCEYVLVIKN